MVIDVYIAIPIGHIYLVVSLCRARVFLITVVCGRWNQATYVISIAIITHAMYSYLRIQGLSRQGRKVFNILHKYGKFSTQLVILLTLSSQN